MAETVSMALAELLRKADAEPDVDTLREGVRVLTQALMELEVAQHWFRWGPLSRAGAGRRLAATRTERSLRGPQPAPARRRPSAAAVTPRR